MIGKMYKNIVQKRNIDVSDISHYLDSATAPQGDSIIRASP